MHTMLPSDVARKLCVVERCFIKNMAKNNYRRPIIIPYYSNETEVQELGWNGGELPSEEEFKMLRQFIAHWRKQGVKRRNLARNEYKSYMREQKDLGYPNH